MQGKVRLIIICFILLIVASCASSRKKGSFDQESAEGGLSSAYILQEARENNILKDGIVISKGRIKLITDEFEGSFSFSGRINTSGDYVISVRGPLGIELFRAISVEESIYIINRIEKAIYIGKTGKIAEGYEINKGLFEIMVGDIPDKAEIIEDYGSNKEKRITVVIGNGNRIMEIDSGISKACEQTVKDGINGNMIRFMYSDFQRIGDRKYPELISVRENEGDFNAVVSIEEIQFGYSDEIQVKLPDYKIVEL